MLKTVLTQALAAPPVWHALRARSAPKGSVTILCYHTLGEVEGWTARRVADFRADLAMLRRAGLGVLSLDDALARLGDRDAAPSVVLTFDDGDRGLARHLPDILGEDPVPLTIYVATSQIETGRPFWFDRVVNALQGPCRIRLPGLGHWTLGDETGPDRWRITGEILAALKTLPEEARDEMADRVAGQGAAAAGAPLGPMTRDDLARLATDARITIGAHSHGHELLDRIPLPAARDSILTSRDLLRDWTGQAVAHFAYPNGNHSPELRAMLRDEGFSSATILEERPARATDDAMALPRVSVGRYDSPLRVKVRMAGL